MTNGDFIRSMTDEDITENFTPGICGLKNVGEYGNENYHIS